MPLIGGGNPKYTDKNGVARSCGYATVSLIVVHKTGFVRPSWYTRSRCANNCIEVDHGVQTAEACQAKCRDHGSCDYFSYELEGFKSFEMSSARFTGPSNSLDWLVVSGQDIVCEPNEIYTRGQCVTCASGQQPVNNKCVQCTSGHAGVDGLCVKCEAGKVPNDGSFACDPCSSGMHSAPGAFACTMCSEGKADVDANPSTACTTCPVGTYSKPETMRCTPCPPSTADEDKQLVTGLAVL